jgi:REP element-mobilizing transposase RayT
LHAYLGGAFKALDCPVVIIGGVADHVHILCLLTRRHPVSYVLKEAKGQSSKWIKMKGGSLRRFEWQRGYGIFSVGPDGVETVRRYIARQEEHHRQRHFTEEYREILRKNGLDYDERYVWD